MTSLRDDINEVILANNIHFLTFVRIHDWQWILNKFAEAFLVHGICSLERIWLWDSLKQPYTSYPIKNALGNLDSILNDEQSYWFIASDEDGKYWVLDGIGCAIVSVLYESRPFEYYITNKTFTWMVCENHHGVFSVKNNL